MKSRSNNIELSSLPVAIHQAILGPHLEVDTFNEAFEICKQFNFGGICTGLAQIPIAREKLGVKSKSKLIGTISFPFGLDPICIKKSQAEWASLKGADELDMVPNFFALNKGEIDLFAEEIAIICEIGLPVRVILNSTFLNPNQLSNAIDASIDAGASGLQTGNGFGGSVTASNIHEIKKLVQGRCHIKAVGGIRRLSHVIELLEAGANNIGTCFGAELMQELRNLKK